MRSARWFRFATMLVLVAVLAAACGDSDDATSPSGGGDAPAGSGSDDGGSDDGEGGGGDASDGDGAAGDGASDGGDGPDTSDAAAIVGQTTLPEAVEELLDDIDDVVSIGECQSELVGLGMPAPDNWMCRVLDQAQGGLDGFTLFTTGNELNITIGTPSPLGPPCEILQACDEAEAIALSDNFPDTMQYSIAGTVTIWGTYKNSDAELVITSLTALDAEDVAFVSTVLDSVVEIG